MPVGVGITSKRLAQTPVGAPPSRPDDRRPTRPATVRRTYVRPSTGRHECRPYTAGKNGQPPRRNGQPTCSSRQGTLNGKVYGRLNKMEL